MTAELFLLGGFGYGICELVWRGYTHISMVLAGGICFCVIYEGEKKFGELSLLLRCVASGVFITSVELVFGSIVNVILGLGVWDYSTQPFNFYGQICLGFSLLWMALSLPVIILCGVVRRNMRKCDKKYMLNL